jgi:hypothetical protein
MIFVTQTSQDSETSPEINSLKVEFLDESPQVKELTSLELRLLIANDVIYGITAQDVNKISDIITTGNLVYFKPSACGDSYLDYSGGGSDEGKSDWLLGGGNCMVETFEGNCPQIGCYKCGTGSSLVNLNLISLSLTNSPIAEYIDNSDTSIPDENTDSNYMYWIIGLIIIIIITAILFFVKKKK